MLRISYWVLPIISGTVWLGMLLGLLLHWIVDTGCKFYPSMSEGQHVAYISDVGAGELKPLFIAGCVVTTVFLDAAFLADRWLRHRGRLVPTSTLGEKVLSGLTIFFALVGTVGLILLSIFDTLNHPQVHRIFLLLFMGGYALSAIFICWEYQSLGRNREHRVLRISFWIKLVFVIVEVVLSITFGAMLATHNQNQGAILEWVIAFIFTFYVMSFFVDLYPAIYTGRHGHVHRRPPALDAFRTKGMPRTEPQQQGQQQRQPQQQQQPTPMSQTRVRDLEEARPDSLPIRSGGNGLAPLPRPPPQDF